MPMTLQPFTLQVMTSDSNVNLIDLAVRRTITALERQFEHSVLQRFSAEGYGHDPSNEGLVRTTVLNDRTRALTELTEPSAGAYYTIAIAAPRPIIGIASEPPPEAPVQNNEAQEPFVRKSVYERLLGPSIWD